MDYHVEQMWAGWWGGFGSSDLIEARVNRMAADGYRLVNTKIWPLLWFWFFPRPRVLLFFERPKVAPAA